MFIMAFNSASKHTSKLTLSTQTFLFLCVIMFRYLSMNQLSGAIPSSIENLAQLQVLYVYSCFQSHQQTHIKTNSFNPNFSIFCVIVFRALSFNHLSGTIPPSVGNLANLSELYVHSCFQFHQHSHIKLTLTTQTSLFCV